MSEQSVRVVCSDCGYSHVVHPDDDDCPADYILEHGRETGHHLSTESLDEAPDRVST